MLDFGNFVWNDKWAQLMYTVVDNIYTIMPLAPSDKKALAFLHSTNVQDEIVLRKSDGDISMTIIRKSQQNASIYCEVQAS